MLQYWRSCGAHILSRGDPQRDLPFFSIVLVEFDTSVNQSKKYGTATRKSRQSSLSSHRWIVSAHPRIVEYFFIHPTLWTVDLHLQSRDRPRNRIATSCRRLWCRCKFSMAFRRRSTTDSSDTILYWNFNIQILNIQIFNIQYPIWKINDVQQNQAGIDSVVAEIQAMGQKSFGVACGKFFFRSYWQCRRPFTLARTK